MDIKQIARGEKMLYGLSEDGKLYYTMISNDKYSGWSEMEEDKEYFGIKE